jgi:hypothetical protein
VNTIRGFLGGLVFFGGLCIAATQLYVSMTALRIANEVSRPLNEMAAIEPLRQGITPRDGSAENIRTRTMMGPGFRRYRMHTSLLHDDRIQFRLTTNSVIPAILPNGISRIVRHKGDFESRLIEGGSWASLPRRLSPG